VYFYSVALCVTRELMRARIELESKYLMHLPSVALCVTREIMRARIELESKYLMHLPSVALCVTGEIMRLHPSPRSFGHDDGSSVSSRKLFFSSAGSLNLIGDP